MSAVGLHRRATTRGHPAYWAFILHRLSGLGLALFVPVHLYVLALVVEDAARFDGFVQWTQTPLVKFAEAGLVILLAAHLTGGLRLLALEFLAWRDWQKTAIALAFGAALVCGLAYLLAAW